MHPPAPAPSVEILGPMGRGAHSVVYRARRGAESVAVKRSLGAAGSAEQRQFLSEAICLARLRHPALPRIIDVVATSSHPWVLLELADGKALDQLVAAGPLHYHQIARLAGQVASALADLHHLGMVHSDIKSSNILLTDDGQVKLLDFDLISPASNGGNGTHPRCYLSPEQSGAIAHSVDARTDLYRLGVILFECATGRMPFNAADPASLAQLQMAYPAPDVRTVRPGFSPALAAMVAKLLAIAPAERYQSARALAHDLAHLADFDAQARAGDAIALATHDNVYEAARPPRVDRGVALQQLIDLWKSVTADHGHIALLTGAPGSGKTRLVCQLLANISASGSTSLLFSTACDPLHTMPFMPLCQAFDALFDQFGSMHSAQRHRFVRAVARAATGFESVLRPLSPGFAATLGPGLRSTDEPCPIQLSAAVSTFITRLAREMGSGLIIIDDLQRLDAATQRILWHLVQQTPSAPLLLVLVARDDPESQALVGEMLGSADDPHRADVVPQTISIEGANMPIMLHWWPTEHV